MAKKSALGRGLNALIDDNKYKEIKQKGVVNEIDVTKIDTNPFQPRTQFDNDKLHELSMSIKKLGIIQPITVSEKGKGKYILISGERRLRASKLAGLKTIPAYVREADDQSLLEMALVENIQREDLNAIEIAISYQRLLDECSLTQEGLSERIGKSRSSITNYIRLLKLPAEVQIGIRDKKIAMGHARAIISIADPNVQKKLYFKTINNELSVRQTETEAKNINTPNSEKTTTKKPDSLSDEILSLQNNLSDRLKTKIGLKRYTNGKGKIVIPFVSDDDLNRIIELLDNKEKPNLDDDIS